ncbi:MAG: type IV pilus twitching motility protein PilT [Desulfovibrio sp.]
MQRTRFNAIVSAVLKRHPRLSDILFTAGTSVQAEVDGELRPVRLRGLEVLGPEDARAVAECLLGDNLAQRRLLAERGSCDFSLSLPDNARFRVNVFRQRGNLAVVMRRLPERIPGLEELGLPTVFNEIAREQNGLALITGGTGTGKSHSLAALVDAINAQRAVHVVTLEDPVEFAHVHKRGVVSQRELLTDFDSFASGLRAALRQAPKVIVVGEIRDRETMEIVLQAAGTGHLVLATLHTRDAGATINRILGLFETQEERLVRMQLAGCLRCIVSQRLLPRVGGGRVPAFEILRNTLGVRELVLQGEQEDRNFYSLLEQGGPHGMNTFDQSLFGLYEQGMISEETALLSAGDRSRLVRMIDRLKTGRGETVSDLRLSGLEEDLDADLR